MLPGARGTGLQVLGFAVNGHADIRAHGIVNVIELLLVGVPGGMQIQCFMIIRCDHFGALGFQSFDHSIHCCFVAGNGFGAEDDKIFGAQCKVGMLV